MKRRLQNRLALLAATGLTFAAPVAVAAQDADIPPSPFVVMEVDADSLQLAREIVDNGFPPEGRMDVFGAVMQQVVAQMNVALPALQGDDEILGLVKFYQKRAIDEGLAVLGTHLDAMMEGMAIAYADIFTADELLALYRFITSPEGHGFFAKSAGVNTHPAYTQASQGFLNEYLAGVPAIQADLQISLEELLADRAAKNDAAE